MNQPVVDTIRWTTADLELLPEDDGRRYEIIDGALHVTRAPHWGHQKICGRLGGALDSWSLDTGLGEASIAPGIIFADADNVIPDLVWASQERLADSLDDAGHLTAAPELVVEVLSPGEKNERRDRDLKLRLYSARGVREYWIISRPLQSIEVYRRSAGVLALNHTLLIGDQITSPMLSGFRYPVDRLFR
ncbi:Uma2 family endonuclease [filamentous cyanobacterium LEGE 11480]|uniref:Uma2 family endonuclease n=1 Tax=Romeriopsis navalis LEGE 11480 TaxID=2777977 RepID=A0A928VQ05_9CYAN|nr:Uma2 family endonuclease [Romeriopsis navalis]MBE9032370.1 Uma2 family endonuclease [Romeriopsis navalis LEGE 11480]